MAWQYIADDLLKHFMPLTSLQSMSKKMSYEPALITSELSKVISLHIEISKMALMHNTLTIMAFNIMFAISYISKKCKPNSFYRE